MLAAIAVGMVILLFCLVLVSAFIALFDFIMDVLGGEGYEDIDVDDDYGFVPKESSDQ